jgi:curli biogenesis system outer membrane secretion channel CsgG
MLKQALTIAFGLGMVALAPLAGSGTADAQAPLAKPKIAVVAFKNPTSWWGRELGASAAGQLTTKLVNSGVFTVLERERSKEIFDEWYLGQSGAVAAGKAVEPGKLEGVQYLVTGEFKSFNIKQRGGRLRIPGTSTAVGGTQMIAESAINVRVISVSTGEIIAAAESKGDKSIGGGGSINGNSYSTISDSSPWNPTIAEDALGPALDKIAADIVSQRSRFPNTAPVVPTATTLPAIAGLAQDGSVYIDQGQNSGVAVGTRFNVMRIVDVIKDAKGNLLDNVTRRVGVIEVTQVLARSAICKVIEGMPGEKDLLEAAR